MSDSPLIYRQDGPVATVALNRPDRRNAMNLAMFRLLPEMIAKADGDPEVKSVVIRGVTRVAFAAGADIAEFVEANRDPATTRAFQDAVLTAMDAVENCRKPVVAVIAGPCVGAGCALALACDLRFADDSARFGITPAKLGLVYSVADSARLAAAVGISRARDLLFSGRLIDAAHALAYGLIDFLHPADQLEAAVTAYLSALHENSQFSIRANKSLLAQVRRGATFDDEAARALFAEAFTGADYREGTAAFLTKRAPKFPFQ